MAKGKKFDFRVVESEAQWSAEIIRRSTSKKTVVSTRQDGFATESEAQAWGQQALESFLQNLKKRNKRRDEVRKEQAT